MWKKHKRKEDKLNYCKLRDAYNDEIKKKRSCYYNQHIGSLKGNSKELYKCVNKIIGKSTSSSLPAYANIDSVLSDFRDYFVTKIKDCRQQTMNHTLELEKDHVQFNCTPLDKNPCPSTFSMFEIINEEDIIEIVNSMNNSTCQLDPMPTSILKPMVKVLVPVLCYIVNKSLQSGQFPSLLKHALVKPTLKKCNLDPDILKNYRPVSNLTFLSKLIEKAALKQFNKYLNFNDLYNSHQSGYRENHSCETAMVKILDDMYGYLERDEAVVLLLLDLSSAFDTIDHTILLAKLKSSYGIQGTALKWIRSYLDMRSFEVFIEGKGSIKEWLLYGVPQGSLLGPLLFILYTKDITAIALKHGLNIHIYADDTQLYIAFKPIGSLVGLKDKICNCLKEIKLWMSKNFLQVNENKTELLVISSKTCDPSCIDMNFTIDFAGTEVLCSDEGYNVKSLGIELDTGLTLERHVIDICKQCYCQLKNLGRTGHCLDSNIKLILVKTLMMSRIDYCNAIYINISTHLMKKLQSVINACIRFIYNLTRREHITHYLKKAHILPMKSRVTFKICLLVHKCVFATAPIYLQDTISQYWPLNESLRSTEDIYKLTIPAIPKNQFSKKRFQYNAALNWNILPRYIRMCNDTNKFKTSLKTHLFETAFE